jgi:hypothetical protein
MKLRLTGGMAVALCLWILPAGAAEPQLTIYNQNFAVVRVLIPLDLKPGAKRFGVRSQQLPLFRNRSAYG